MEPKVVHVVQREEVHEVVVPHEGKEILLRVLEVVGRHRVRQVVEAEEVLPEQHGHPSFPRYDSDRLGRGVLGPRVEVV